MRTAEIIKMERIQPPLEAGSFTRRIGSTTYRVGVHFSTTSKETASDKILRLVRMDAEKRAVNL